MNNSLGIENCFGFGGVYLPMGLPWWRWWGGAPDNHAWGRGLLAVITNIGGSADGLEISFATRLFS